MKKLNRIALIFLLMLGLFSCEEEVDPVINSAAEDGTLTFQLNEPTYSEWTYVLEEENADSAMEVLTCVQPDYGFTAAVTYTIQACFDENFNDEAYESLATTVTGEEVEIITSEMDEAINALYGGTFPDTIVAVDVYIRLMAEISDATAGGSTDTVLTVKPAYSNVISLNIKPYYYSDLVSYSETTPVPYYIIGMGDGNWTNDASGLGVSFYPMSVVDGNKYDADGNGEFIYTGYFEASQGFKLIRDIGSWDEQWGSSDGALEPDHNNSSSDNFYVPSDGYYTITLNSISDELSIEETSVTLEEYTSISMIGDVTDDWSTDIEMTASESTNNHMWYTTYTFSTDATDSDEEGVKFRTTGSWDTNWGSLDFPVGIASSGGSNIQYESGTYVICFNDVDGCYYFFEQ